MMDEQQETVESPLLSKSAEGATVLILLQIGSRILTFSANQFLLRYLSPELLGLSNQLEVYSISILFFSREALRVAVQRQRDAIDNPDQGSTSSRKGTKQSVQARRIQAAVNLAHVSILLGIIFALLLAWAYLRSVRSNLPIKSIPYFNESLRLYGVAACVELLAEPVFTVVQIKSHYRIRAAAESLAALSRCVVTCGCVIFAVRHAVDLGVFPFAFGQGAYSVTLVSVYYAMIWKRAAIEGFSLQIRKITGDRGEYMMSYFPRPLMSLATSLFVQGIVKHFLTQGDTILISYLTSLEAQGVYALASNYGGLIARMIFQPVEESSRNYFGKLLSSIDGQPSKDVIHSAKRDLQNLLRFYFLISIVAIAVGPTFAPLFIKFIAGSRWSVAGAGNVLAKYCYYIPILAINGVSEAFISAVASKSEVNRQSGWMIVFSLGFAFAGYIFLNMFDLGAEGLVWANVVSMGLRIIWSFTFIDSYFRRNGDSLDFSMILPRITTVAIGLGTAAIFAQARPTYEGSIVDLGKVALISIGLLILLGIFERKYLTQLYQLGLTQVYRNRKK